MEYKDFITIGISLLALLVSGTTYLRERKKSKNISLRLLMLSEAIKGDFQSLKFLHSMIYFIPDMKNKEYEASFNSKKISLESNIAKFYDLLLLNQKISDEDVKLILRSLLSIESNLFELAAYTVESQEDLEVTLAFVNPIYDELETIGRIVKEYDTH